MCVGQINDQTTNNFIVGLKHTKSIAMYEKTHRMVETASEIVIFFFVKVTIPLVTIPIVMHSFFVYFTTGLPATVAFELPIPMW